jgi:hypothetical protein
MTTKHIEEILIESRGDDFASDPYSDYDPMYAEAPGDEGRARCTCGYRAAMAEADRYDHHDYPDVECFAGCRGCDPVDHEAKPYGFGIESFEDPALHAANDATREAWIGGPYRSLKGANYCTVGATWCGPRFNRDLRDAIWRRLSRHSARRERHSKIVWDRICDAAETHREAVERYKAWAKRAVTVKYRDEA